MNQQIRELAEQAGMGHERWNTTAQFESFLEKFAELIVRECAKFLAENSGYDNSNNAWHPEPEDLLKHFGVEETRGWVCPKCNADRTKIACPLGFSAQVDGRCPMTAEAQ